MVKLILEHLQLTTTDKTRKKWETDNNDHVSICNSWFVQEFKSVIDGVVLKDANGNPMGTAGWTASISYPKQRLNS